MSRRERRQNFAETDRIGLLEDDLDDLHTLLAQSTSGVRESVDVENAKVRAELEVYSKKVDRNTTWLVTMLISLTTSAVLLTLNLLLNSR